MNQLSTLVRFSISLLLLLSAFGISSSLKAQSNIRDYVIFGGNGTCPTGPGQTPPPFPGCAVQIGSSTKIDGGSIGSYTFITSTGNTTINSNLISGGTIQLANSNVVNGRISANNRSKQAGTILSVGSSAKITGKVDVNGNIIIGGGTVSGPVIHTPGTTYYLGNILVPNTEGNPDTVAMPALPDISEFPAATDSTINKTMVLNPGSYGKMRLTGNNRITFNGPGVYVFEDMQNTGNSNVFIYDFQNLAAGTIKIFVHGYADLGKIGASTKSGGGASRVLFEGHG